MNIDLFVCWTKAREKKEEEKNWNHKPIIHCCRRRRLLLLQFIIYFGIKDHVSFDGNYFEFTTKQVKKNRERKKNINQRNCFCIQTITKFPLAKPYNRIEGKSVRAHKHTSLALWEEMVEKNAVWSLDVPLHFLITFRTCSAHVRRSHCCYEAMMEFKRHVFFPGPYAKLEGKH